MINPHACETKASRHLVFYLPGLEGGGVERMRLNLVPAFEARGFRVTFVLNRAHGRLLDLVPPSAEIVDLKARHTITALPRLVSYLRRARPHVLVSSLGHNNIAALVARHLGSRTSRVVVSQHNFLTQEVRAFANLRYRALPILYRFGLPLADGVVAVSEGVADDMAAATGFERSRIAVIHNPVVTDDLARRADAPIGDETAAAWLADGSRPVLIAVGRLVAQKDHATLLEAFAMLRARRPCRLLVLGDGPLREALLASAKTLGIHDDVLFAGFVANPYPLIKRAAVLVLASRYEGFGNVLVEALACGTQVVSTDCPAGPAEILDRGRYGALVPPGDPAALARALADVLADPMPGDQILSGARRFRADTIADRYVALFDELLARTPEASARIDPPARTASRWLRARGGAMRRP